jgi:fructoselysine 6-kinase
VTAPSDRSPGAPAAVLLGPASLDCYVDEHLVLPGGGALNMAFHLSSAGDPVHLLTRVGADRSTLFTDFFERHHISSSPSLVGEGATSSIDIRIGDDRQPWMDNFVEGVWRDFRLTADDERTLISARQLHVVLVAPVVAELDRLAADGLLAGLTVSGDFLSFRRWNIERFARTMAHLDLGVVGWPGAPDDPLLDEMRDVAYDLGTLVVVTLGAQGVRVFDGRHEPMEAFVPVDAVAVAGTTVGCGDAFVAAFLRDWWRGASTDAAVAAGARAGAAATAWVRPLPDDAY